MQLTQNKFTASDPKATMSTLITLSFKDSQLLIFGWIREHSKDSCNAFPNGIKALCIKWYFIQRDEWNLTQIPEGVKIDKETATLVHKDNYTYTQYITVVGSKQVSASTHINEWKWKLHGGYHFIIGIIPNSTNAVNNKAPLWDYGYGFDTFDGSTKKYGKNQDTFKSLGNFINGEVVVLRFIMKSRYGEIHCGRNEGRFIKIFESIEVKNNEIYKFAVSFYQIGGSVQLLQ